MEFLREEAKRKGTHFPTVIDHDVSWRTVVGKRGSIPASILRGARSKVGITQVKLSELIGIPQRHISEMEQGKRPIGKETAKKFASAYAGQSKMGVVSVSLNQLCYSVFIAK